MRWRADSRIFMEEQDDCACFEFVFLILPRAELPLRLSWVFWLSKEISLQQAKVSSPKKLLSEQAYLDRF